MGVRERDLPREIRQARGWAKMAAADEQLALRWTRRTFGRRKVAEAGTSSHEAWVRAVAALLRWGLR